jgi:hypothetical protein
VVFVIGDADSKFGYASGREDVRRNRVFGFARRQVEFGMTSCREFWIGSEIADAIDGDQQHKRKNPRNEPPVLIIHD